MTASHDQATWKVRARQLKREVYTLLLVARDARVPWYARFFIVGLLAYAFSPIDLIPDFIPVLGYLDDLILLPLGILLAIKLIPVNVLEECRAQAQERMKREKPTSWSGAIAIILVWLFCAGVLVTLLMQWLF